MGIPHGTYEIQKRALGILEDMAIEDYARMTSLQVDIQK